MGDCGCVALLGGVSESDVLGVVEVFGECLGDGVEFVFDHDVDVVGGEAGAHEFFGGWLWWRRGRGRSLWWDRSMTGGMKIMTGLYLL